MKTWILAANAAEARLFAAGEADGHLTELASFSFPEGRMHRSELTSGHAGRVQESANSARHAIEPRLDPHDKVATQFAHGLAHVLEHGRVEHEYQRLVLMASPRFLGQLRGSLDEQVSRLVVESVDKDMTRSSVEEIEALIQD